MPAGSDLAAALRRCPEAARAPLERGLRGELSPEMALMHLLIELKDPSRVAGLLAGLEAAARADSGCGEAMRRRLARLARLAEDNRPGAEAVVAMLRHDLDHGGAAASPEEGIARWAAMFDRAVRRHAEASVALYALGNPELLRRATAEIVDRMREWGLVGRGRALLEIGCGIGRFEETLAAEAASVVGIDISPGMIEAARARCAGLANVRLLPCSGRDLAMFGAASFDLVFSVDAFPYLVQSGMALAERHVEEAGRVLRPGGDLLILNFSYRGDLQADCDDVGRLAAAFGFDVRRLGIRAFELWDGTAFHLKKADPRQSRPA
jgi:ubiquinone/menaquinone biosynthesis C-methylase UbiE